MGAGLQFRVAAVRIVKPAVPARAWSALKAAGAGVVAPVNKAKAWSAKRALSKLSLSELAEHFGTDKWGIHRYTPHYHEHLSALRNETFTILELGIGGYSIADKGGASLRMWQEYFPKASIVGLDIEDKSFVVGERISTYLGSQVDPQVLERIVDDHPDIRVIIDDGSHRAEHVRESFTLLFPRLADGGVYVIEDIQTSYWPEYGGDEDLHSTNTSMAMVKDLLDGLNYEEFIDETHTPTYTELNVIAVHAYHNLIFIEKGSNCEGTNRRETLTTRYPPA